MKTFKAALFDLDGTLFDTEGQYSIFWGKTCRRFRPDIDRLEYKIKGMTLVQIYDKYFPDPKVQAIITEGLNEWEMQMRYNWIAGAEDFVMDCKRHGVKCAIVTSSNQMKMKAVAAQLPHFDALFDRVLTSEDFTASKPAPDCYLLGAKSLDWTSTSALSSKMLSTDCKPAWLRASTPSASPPPILPTW